MDERGILRKVPWRRPRRERSWLTSEEEAELRSFAADRKVRQLGNVNFWLVITFVRLPTRRGVVERQGSGYRQTARLRDDEVARLMRLHPLARAQLFTIPRVPRA